MFNDLDKLKGKKIKDIGRAGDMVWFSFGNTIRTIKHNGDEVIKAEYAIHVQCPWRILKNNRILIGNYDIYIPSDEIWRENFNWDVKGKNLFDKKVSEERKFFKDKIVQSIVLNENGDLKVLLENSYQIELFVNSSKKEEFWRFLDNKKNKHIVCFEDMNTIVS